MNKRLKARLVLKRKVKIFISKLLVTIIIFLIGMILVKNNPQDKLWIQTSLYEKSFPFQQIKLQYEKYFGNLLSGDKIFKKTEPVFQEKMVYDSLEKYHNGVKLKVSDHYPVPVIESGIIVFIGEKEEGNTVIVEQIDGVDVYYANISIGSKKLYDYVEKGEFLGEVEGNEFYLTFQKKGEYLDYKNYL